MDKVNAVGVHEVGESRRATDSGDHADFFVRNAELLHDVEKGSKDGEVTTSGTPSRVIGFELLLGELFSRSGRDGIRHFLKGLFVSDQLLGGGDEFKDAEADALDLVGRLNLRVASLSAEEGGKLAIAIHAGVVHLGDEDVVVTVKYFGKIARKRMDVAEMHGAHFLTFGIHAVGCFFDRAVGRTPADEEE